jgi:Fe2+ transport system protein FeoA
LALTAHTHETPGAHASQAVSLLDCAAGATVWVDRIPAELACAQRLRELGIVEGAELMILRHSDPLLVLAKESRIAIDLITARAIEVTSEQE